MTNSGRDIQLLLALLAGGLACGALALAYGPTPQLVELALFAGVLVHLSWVDLRQRTIPNADLACASAVRLAYLALAVPLDWPGGEKPLFYLASAVGVLAILLITVLVADRLLGGESMGGGDLKLFAVCALYVGWRQCLGLVFVACLLGLASSLVLVRPAKGEQRTALTFPFGPAIAVACLLTLTVGPALEAVWL